ncbi:MAG: GNAT family N-acetyltransferase [Dehalococcoidia bacterium]|nr:GNAT family N-acetyltransferase [Dehalococcoidia bacterium]
MVLSNSRTRGRKSIASLTLTELAADGDDPFGSQSGACETLLGRTACPTVFSAPWWISAWHQVFVDGEAARIIEVRDASDLVGIAPLIRDGDRLLLAGDPDLFDYQDLVLVKGRELELTGALLDFLEGRRYGPTPWRSLELPSTRVDSPTNEALTAAAHSRGLTVERHQVGVAPVVDLPGSWEEYVSSLPKKHRHELRRKIRRLEASGQVRQVTFAGEDGLGSEVEDFLRLMSATNDDKATFLTPDRRRFFHLLAQEAASRGALRLSFLEIDGQRTAACLIFDFAGAYMLYNSGYDPARADLSVGLINKAYAIREAIESGRRRFDFLKGAERYKYSLGGQDRAIYRIVVTR